MSKHIRIVGRHVYKQNCESSRHGSTMAVGKIEYMRGYEDARPFSEIPGPTGLPYLGTILQYRKGKQFTIFVTTFTGI